MTKLKARKSNSHGVGWISFIPAGGIAYGFTEILSHAFFRAMDPVIGGVLSGILSAAAFLTISLAICPSKSARILWTLVGLISAWAALRIYAFSITPPGFKPSQEWLNLKTMQFSYGFAVIVAAVVFGVAHFEKVFSPNPPKV